MSKARLPSRPADTWEGGFLTDPARDVRSVNARGGLIVAGGADLYLVRPGAQQMMTRPPPLDIGLVHVAAAEGRGQRRYAVASEEMIAIFYRNKQGDQLIRLRASPPGPRATHLAWGGVGARSTLHVRHDDGAILRMNVEMNDMESLNVPPAVALASDDNGAVALITFDPEPLVYVTLDGETFHYRPVDVDGLDPDPGAPVHLAVAGLSVAFSIGGGGAYVSRGDDDPFTRCDDLAAAGPLEFEGPSPDAALFGAIADGHAGAIVRVDRAGAAMRLAEYGSDGADRIEIASLSWDASRQTLWGASPQAGLVTQASPAAKRGKAVMLS